MTKKPEELSDKEQDALDLLKSNIKELLEEQLDKDRAFSHNHSLNGIQEVVFEQFEGEEEIDPSRHRPLLMRALKEVVAKYEE